MNLVRRGKPTPNVLPHKFFDLEGNLCTPNIFERFHRKAARRRLGLGNRVSLLREQGEELSKMLPLNQLFRRERTTKTQVPIITREIRDGNLWRRTIREKNWKGRAKVGVTTPPVEPETGRSVITHHKPNMGAKTSLTLTDHARTQNPQPPRQTWGCNPENI